MKPAQFNYYRPASIDDTVAALAESPSAKLLAGGQSLIPAMNFRLATPSLLIDIGHLEDLSHVEVTPERVTIGAAVTQREVETSAAVALAVPGLKEALRWVGHLQIRNRGTVCGSLAHADPAAELPALAVALGAEISVRGATGIRRIPAEGFIRGPFWTALEPGELIIEVAFPAQPPNVITVVEELARRAGDFAIVGAVGKFVMEDASIREATLVGFAVAGTPVRLSATEASLRGVQTIDQSVLERIRETVAEDVPDPLEDIHATSEYRREAIGALVGRMVQEQFATTDRRGN